MNAVSRTKRFWLRVALAAFGAAASAGEASAQIGWSPSGEVCTAERTVSGVVTEKKTCVRWKPVTQVCMKRQDCMTYRDECRVGYRPEQYVECVPKTCYDPVTVDEGCWKMVWCPKPVTKMVPRQTVEKRIACRNVPYTYTEKVPQLVSRWVPECRTSYVPETYTTCERRPFCQTLPSQTTAMMPSCAAPEPSCATPVEPSCATPSLGMTPMMARYWVGLYYPLNLISTDLHVATGLYAYNKWWVDWADLHRFGPDGAEAIRRGRLGRSASGAAP